MSASAVKVNKFELTYQFLTNQSIKIGRRARPTRGRGEKSKATVFPACNSCLNFLIRGQLEFKIVILPQINTTYFIWIKKKKTWACDHLKTNNLSAESLTGRHPSPQYGQVILVSEYPVLTAVNWSQYFCAIFVQYQFFFSPKLARKCGIEHWFPCGSEGRAGERCMVTRLPNFLGWVDLLSYGASLARASRAWSSAIKLSFCINWCKFGVYI